MTGSNTGGTPNWLRRKNSPPTTLSSRWEVVSTPPWRPQINSPFGGCCRKDRTSWDYMLDPKASVQRGQSQITEVCSTGFWKSEDREEERFKPVWEALRLSPAASFSWYLLLASSSACRHIAPAFCCFHTAFFSVYLHVLPLRWHQTVELSPPKIQDDFFGFLAN